MPKRKLPFKATGVAPAGSGSLSSLDSGVAVLLVLQGYPPPGSCAVTQVGYASADTGSSVSTSSRFGGGRSSPVAPGSTAKRGSLALALAAASSEQAFAHALAKMHKDKYADTTNQSRASWFKTWMILHDAAFEDTDPPPPHFPLTVTAINRIAALCKAGRYLSYDNYVLRAKSAHMERGGTDGLWTQELAIAVKETIRSVGRGAGAARQSLPVDLMAIAKLCISDEPVVNDGPLGPCDLVTIGCMLLMREIELSAAEASSIVVLPGSKSITWHLPSSKTDPRALGVYRSWDCTCGITGLEACCLVHAAIRQLGRIDRLSAVLGCDASSLPLFPNRSGEECSEHAVVSTIKFLVQTSGRP